MNLDYREAKSTDLKALVELLADDVLGQTREDVSSPLNPLYLASFSAISADPNNELIVVESNHQLVGMLQLTFIPYLTHTGSWRCLIEGVRIAQAFRGKGLGSELIQWSIGRAQERGCSMVQLTSDKQRPDAIRFYETLGFVASHEGFKLQIGSHKG